jgi:hypothetical protein
MDLRIYPLPLPNIPTMISMMRFLLFLKLEVVGFSTSPSGNRELLTGNRARAKRKNFAIIFKNIAYFF